MEQKKVTRDFKVLAEKISPDNVAVMAELIAMKETKILISYLGHHAEKAHKNLCRDIFGKHEPGYIFSDSYDFVQSVALFLCDHFGEYLDDVLYISKRGKPDYRVFRKCQSLEITREEPKPEYGHQSDEEQDYSRADEIAASLNLTENMSLALDYRMSGLSYPEIAKQLSRAVSTVIPPYMDRSSTSYWLKDSCFP